MITLLRDFTKSKLFVLLMGLLILSFAVFGLPDVLNQLGASQNVVTAGKHVVSAREFRQLYDQQKQSWSEQNNGQTFTNEQFVEEGAHLNMLEQLADKIALDAWLDQQGVKPSAKLIVEQLTQVPVFINSATGKFDKTTYLEALQKRGLDQVTFERETYERLSYTHFETAAMAGIKAPRIYSLAEGAIATQTRDVSFFFITRNSVPAAPTPTNDDITAYYKVNESRFVSPEFRKASIVILNAQQFEANVQVSDEELRKAYQVSAAALSTPETRAFVQVTAPDMKAASAISAALKAGQSPEAAAKAYKGVVVPFSDQPQNSVPDSKIAAAAFAMATGEVSAPIQGELSIAVIKMGAIKAGSTPSFESVRPKLLEELRTNAAANKLNKVSNELADAMAAGEDFAASAQKLGLKITDLPAMTVEGRIATPRGLSSGQGDDYSRFPAIVKTIYGLQPGTTSEVEEMGKGQYYVIKLNSIVPSAAPPIDSVRPYLIELWQQEKLATAISEKAESLMARLNKGEAIATVAASANAKVDTIKGFDRMGRTPQSQQPVNRGLVGRVFLAKPGESFQIPVSAGQIAIGHVDGVHQGDARTTNMEAAKLRDAFSSSISRDINPMARASARKTFKATTNPKLAVNALNVTQTETSDDKAENKDKSKDKNKS